MSNLEKIYEVTKNAREGKKSYDKIVPKKTHFRIDDIPLTDQNTRQILTQVGEDGKGLVFDAVNLMTGDVSQKSIEVALIGDEQGKIIQDGELLGSFNIKNHQVPTEDINLEIIKDLGFSNIATQLLEDKDNIYSFMKDTYLSKGSIPITKTIELGRNLVQDININKQSNAKNLIISVTGRNVEEGIATQKIISLEAGPGVKFTYLNNMQAIIESTVIELDSVKYEVVDKIEF